MYWKWVAIGVAATAMLWVGLRVLPRSGGYRMAELGSPANQFGAGPSCDTVPGNLPRSYHGVCLNWSAAQLRAADPSIVCEAVGSGQVCSQESSQENMASAIYRIAYLLEHNQTKVIRVGFTFKVMAKGVDAMLEQAKAEYGKPIKEKQIVTSELSREQRQELLRQEPTLANNNPLGLALKERMLAASRETIWQDEQTTIIFDYPIFNTAFGESLHRNAQLTFFDRTYEAQLDVSAQQAENRDQQERRNMFGR